MLVEGSFAAGVAAPVATPTRGTIAEEPKSESGEGEITRSRSATQGPKRDQPESAFIINTITSSAGNRAKEDAPKPSKNRQHLRPGVGTSTLRSTAAEPL
jgi:hypothetical protein